MDLGIIILKKSQTEEYKYCMVSFKSRILKKNGTNELIYKTETDSGLVNEFNVSSRD